MIDAAMRARADRALDEVARAEGVRVLLGIESGSRAWGFASRDSDYDVRFVFVRPLHAYLSVYAPGDVIERPLQGTLDLGGWDLRKVLALAVRSNATVLEWLSSPVVYRRAPEMDALAAFARAAAHLPALAYHYDRLARGAWSPGAEPMRLKAMFYAVRPALALLWMRAHGTPPPMSLPALLAGLDVPAQVLAAIADLRRRKAESDEHGLSERDATIEAFLARVLAIPAERPPAWDQAGVIEAADVLLRQLIGA